MSNIFEKSLPMSAPKRSVFDVSRDYKTSFNMGDLIPCFMEELLPGDTIKVGSDVMIRFLPLIAPIMDKVDVRIDYFFVPNRLCCDNVLGTNGNRFSWEDFITGGSDGKSAMPLPNFDLDYQVSEGIEFFESNHLADYFGIYRNGTWQQQDGKHFQCSALPFIAYHLICDNFYLDQTYDTPVMDYIRNNPVFNSTTGTCSGYTSSSGPALKKLTDLRQRLFQKDYFTTAMPTPQRGDSVYLMNPFTLKSSPSAAYPNPASGTTLASYPVKTFTFDGIHTALGYTGSDTYNYYIGSDVTVNDFFTLQSIQRWLNHNQNFGGRYVEQLAGHFSVISSDARLQIPQYLGGGKAPIMISEVLQTATNSTSGTSVSTGVGNMSGHAISFGKTANCRYRADEHGIVLGILSVIPKISYSSAIPKFFFKLDKFDFAFPEFANIGEQPILNKEIFMQGTADDNKTFGYTPRYSEYRCAQSIATGDFRTSLNYWHLARSFSSLPSASLQFLQVTSVNTSRIFQNTDAQVAHLLADVFHNCSVVRPLPQLPNTSLL